MLCYFGDIGKCALSADLEMVARNRSLDLNFHENFFHFAKGFQISFFFLKPRDGAESALFCNMFTGPVDIYEVKRSQRQLLAAIESKI